MKARPLTTPCSHCTKPATIAKLLTCTNGCLKRFYCSEDCQKRDLRIHKKQCVQFQQMRPVPGYFNRFKGSASALTILYEFGRAYLSARQPGAVAFTKYPLSKQEWLENQLKKGSRSTARIWSDPIEKQLYHYFLLPLSALQAYTDDEDYFDPRFVAVCRSFSFGPVPTIPMIQMTIKETEMSLDKLQQKDWEADSLSYYLVVKDELF